MNWARSLGGLEISISKRYQQHDGVASCPKSELSYLNVVYEPESKPWLSSLRYTSQTLISEPQKLPPEPPYMLTRRSKTLARLAQNRTLAAMPGEGINPNSLRC